jgi:hypothetical protein
MVCLGGLPERFPWHRSIPTPVKDHPIRSPLVNSPAIGAGYRVISSKVATLGCKDIKLPVEIHAALSILHGPYQHMQDAGRGKDFIGRIGKHCVRVSLNFRRSAGGSESKSLSSGLDVDGLMTAHWMCLTYQNNRSLRCTDESPAMVPCREDVGVGGNEI